MPKPAGHAVKRPFKAYAGDEPYVFVSYAHADMAGVYQDLAHVHRQRYRIWYDEGVDPASRFPAKIAAKIQGCAQFIVFLSANAGRSAWVWQEINYAVGAEKPRLFVYLEEPPEPTHMSKKEEREFWDTVGFLQAGRDALYRSHWSKAQYLSRLSKFLSSEAGVRKPPNVVKPKPGPVKADLEEDLTPVPPRGTEQVPAAAALEGQVPVASRPTEPDRSQPAVVAPAEAPVAERIANRAATRVTDNVLLPWVRIPGGLFTRGCPEDFIRHVERKFGADTTVLRKYHVRREHIDEFWISVTPVTNAQYYEFVRATGHRYPAGWRGMMPPYPVADGDKPVTGVNFRDSVDFAAWLGARLPTRAEYEKASRGEDGRLFPWGNEFDPKRCNTQESEQDELTPVDAFPDGASPYGVLDLVGNAWEWVDERRGELTMAVGASYRATGEIFGATFFDVSRPPESSEKDLGFRIACRDIRQLQRTTPEAPE